MMVYIIRFIVIIFMKIIYEDILVEDAIYIKLSNMILILLNDRIFEFLKMLELEFWMKLWKCFDSIMNSNLLANFGA